MHSLSLRFTPQIHVTLDRQGLISKITETGLTVPILLLLFADLFGKGVLLISQA
jgi:hypothetical protein